MENKILEMMGQVLSEVKALSEKVDKLDKKVSILELKQEESYQILKALEHSAQINKAEHDNMNNDIAHIKGDVASIKKDLTQVEMVTSSNWNEIARIKSQIQ